MSNFPHLSLDKATQIARQQAVTEKAAFWVPVSPRLPHLDAPGLDQAHCWCGVKSGIALATSLASLRGPCFHALAKFSAVRSLARAAGGGATGGADCRIDCADVGS